MPVYLVCVRLGRWGICVHSLPLANLCCYLQSYRKCVSVEPHWWIITAIVVLLILILILIILFKFPKTVMLLYKHYDTKCWVHLQTFLDIHCYVKFIMYKSVLRIRLVHLNFVQDWNGCDSLLPLSSKISPMSMKQGSASASLLPSTSSL